jgi:hypothetical protein
VNANESNDDEMPSRSLAEWDALMTETARGIRSRLDAWRADDQRIEAILTNLKRSRAINNTLQCKP